MSPEASDGAEAAFQDGLALLERRPLTEDELRRRLADKRHPAAHSERAIERLRDCGYLDDHELARHFIVTRAGRLGHGPGKLIAQLRSRGVEGPAAQRAWDEAVARGEIDPTAMLETEIRRRLRGAARIEDRRCFARVYNALLRAGYGKDRILGALRSFPGAAAWTELDEVDDGFA